jgi:hypothetical protein
MNIITLKILTEDEFLNKFTRQKNHIDTNAGFDGCLFETYGKELDYVFEMSKLNRVVTIIEGEDEDQEITYTTQSGEEITETITVSIFHYASGFHYVNRHGYFVLDKPYEYEFEAKVS